MRSSQTVKCTYIEIPQVEVTNAIMLYKPSWIWGAEMGSNEYGVTIGNEAVFTKSKGKKVERLIGMDMLRLALERSDSARSAIEVLIDLLDKYGQGGNCGFDKPFYYDNSFLVCDGREAFIMETAGNKYCVKQCEGNANISNRLSLENNFDSSNLQCKINFAKKNSDFIFTTFSGSKARSCKASAILSEQQSSSTQGMRKALASHREDHMSLKTLVTRGSVDSVCMHQSPLGDHTTGSMMVEFYQDFNTLWLTGSSTPCLSIYKPYIFGEQSQVVFGSQEESLAYWLNREYLVRAIYAKLIDEQDYLGKVSVLQERFFNEHARLRAEGATKEQFVQWSIDCAELEKQLVESYSTQIQQVKDNNANLPKSWRIATEKLGHNVFSASLISRQGK
ncbi:MAG: peptidase U34 [Clostridia bacterium]